MPEYKKDVAVLLMLFNRPEVTKKLFSKLQEVRPRKLFIAANGPRPDHPEDISLCQQVRDVFNDIDWQCEVHTNYPAVNENMHSRWWQTCNWFFESVDRGIILEDDCIPGISFFDYCIELLDMYQDDERIMHINGSNFQFGNKRGNSSYYFSRYSHVWGWATWKRAWNKYDYEMTTFPRFKEEKTINIIFNDIKQRNFWLIFMEKVYAGILKTSDVRWSYAIWQNQSFCITPNINMISNIGFGASASHTILKDKIMGQETLDMGKINHPNQENIEADKEADLYTFKVCFDRSFFQKALHVAVMKLVKWFR